MAKARKKKKSAFELARSTPSAVARAAFQRSGSGLHGKQGKAKAKAERRSVKQALRRGDY